jgi:hypothetical protein
MQAGRLVEIDDAVGHSCVFYNNCDIPHAMIWTEDRILRELARLHKAGRDISYNHLSRKMQPLVSAAAYHFESYRNAVQRAGIDYSLVLRRPKWTRGRIIALIKSARRKGSQLHWSAVTRRRDELGKAAFASLQPRLFGRWDRALQASGLDPDDVSQYRRWDRNTIVFELRSRYREHEPLGSGRVQKQDAGLHAAAVRYFGNWENALLAAKLDPRQFRLRQRWDRISVIRSLKAAARSGKRVSASQIRRQFPALYGASLRLFGSFTAARAAAKIKFIRRKKSR